MNQLLTALSAVLALAAQPVDFKTDSQYAAGDGTIHRTVEIRGTLRFDAPKADAETQILIVRFFADKDGVMRVRAGRGKACYAADFPIEPGEQMKTVSVKDFALHGPPQPWDKLEYAEIEVAGGASVKLISLSFSKETGVIPATGIWLHKGPSMSDPCGTAVPLYAIVDESFYHKGIAREKENLKKNLKILTGVDLPLNPENAPRTNAILVGNEANVQRGTITRQELEGWGWDGFVLRMKNSNLVIAGKSPQGAGYGVYRFLERQGLKYFAPGVHTDVARTNVLQHVELGDKPYFKKRLSADWCIFGDGGLFADYRSAGVDPIDPVDKTAWIDHTAAFLVPKKLYYKEHPEYYILRGDGKRMSEDTIDVRLMLCQTNEGGIGVAAERAMQWMDRQPERRYFVIQQGDDAEPCVCPTCNVRRAEGWNDSDLFLYWINAIGKKVYTKHPDKVLISYAYALTQPPPNKLKVESPNINILYCPWPNRTSAPNPTRGFDAPGNVIAGTQILAWGRVVPGAQMGIYDYIMGNSNGQRGMAQRIKWLARHNMSGSLWYLGAGSRFFGNMFKYVHCRLNWDPTLDTRQLEDEFIYGYYGNAAPAVERIVSTYFNALDRDKRNDGFGVNKGFFTRRLVEGILKDFDAAIRLSQEKSKLAAELQQDKDYFIDQVFWNAASSPVQESFATAWRLWLGREKARIEESPKNDKANWKSAAGALWSILRIKCAVDDANAKAMPQIIKEMIEDPVAAAEKHRLNKKDFILTSGDSVKFLNYAFNTDVIWDGYRWKCEARDTFFLYGTMTDSHRADVAFDLDASWAQRAATLVMEAQDCDKLAVANVNIKIAINGKTVFAGRNTFRKQGWSTCSFDIPKGFLKEGKNELVIENTTRSDSRISHWIGISSVEIKRSK